MPKVPQVFVSHSRRDNKYRLSFKNACDVVGLKPYFYDIEGAEPPHWKKLQREINKSEVLFLLIGKEFNEIQKSLPPDKWQFTQNWIAYEIGIATQKDIEVWVLCETSEINFPVPYFTNLYFWEGNLAEQKEMISFLEIYKQNKYILFDKVRRYTCSNPKCRITYNIIQSLAKGVEIKCPCCLETQKFTDGFNPNNNHLGRILKKFMGVRLRDTTL